MRLTLDQIGIGDGPGAPLPAVSAEASTGTPGIAAVETEGAPTLASLIAGGRMRPETGRVLIDGADDADRIRASFALVDTPTVAEPFPDLTVIQVVREDLVLADQRGNTTNARLFLDAIGLAAHERTTLRTLPTAARIRLLAELAVLKPGIEGLIVTSPERHGGDTEEWFAVLDDLARRGLTILVITGVAAATHLQNLTSPALATPAAAPSAPESDTL